MNIAWQYLDKREATVSALKDYASMKHIAAHAPQEIEAARERMTATGGGELHDMPRGPFNPHGGEDRVARAMDAMDALRLKYEQAVEFMAWFHGGWDALAENDRLVLRHFYMAGAQRSVNHVAEVCDALNIERTAAYKRKERALLRLSLLLYGK